MAVSSAPQWACIGVPDFLDGARTVYMCMMRGARFRNSSGRMSVAVELCAFPHVRVIVDEETCVAVTAREPVRCDIVCVLFILLY